MLARRCPTDFLPGSASGNRLAIHRSYRTGFWLQREGESGSRLIFVKSGLLIVRQTDADAAERPLAVIGPGHLVGQASLYRLPARFSVRSLSAVSVCEFDAGALLLSLGPVGKTGDCMGRYNYQSLAVLASWSHVMRIPGLQPRLATALRLIASVQPVTAVRLPSQAALSELMGVSRESVNRIWREFEQSGWVRRGEGRLVHLDLRALEQVAAGTGRPFIDVHQ